MSASISVSAIVASYRMFVNLHHRLPTPPKAMQQHDGTVSMAQQRRKLGTSWANDHDKPIFHVCPPQGWANDGNGFIWYKDRYHMCASPANFSGHVLTLNMHRHYEMW